MHKIKAVIGIGNPGTEYQNTYHSAGLLFCDFLIDRLNSKKMADKKLYTVFAPADPEEMLVVKTKSFMNDSGPVIKAVAKNLQLSPLEIAIAHDDSDILLGKYKLSVGKRSAGHRGVQSIINSLGTLGFNRLRIGVRSKPGKALGFVLKKIPSKEFAVLRSLFEEMFLRLKSKTR